MQVVSYSLDVMGEKLFDHRVKVLCPLDFYSPCRAAETVLIKAASGGLALITPLWRESFDMSPKWVGYPSSFVLPLIRISYGKH